MCTLVTAHCVSEAFPLVIAANRDEFFARPSAPAQFWAEAPTVMAGRDLQAGGTWLGITRAGRWAAVTNVQEAASDAARTRSRGALVSDFLLGTQTPEAYLASIQLYADQYRGFNLLVGDGPELWYLSNHDGSPRPVTPGIHAVSNALLDTPWPKVTRVTDGMQRAYASHARPGHETALIDSLHRLLTDRTPAPDRLLPSSRLPQFRRRALSSLFVRMDEYGTCCSTVIVMDAAGTIHFEERVTNPLTIGTGPVQTSAYVFAPAVPGTQMP